MPVITEDSPIESIRPYEGNPRINDAAVDAVADSIKEFGFRQPIVVDPNNVIIIGHTRLLAAKKLGLTTVPVHIADLPADKVKALRIADNQTASLSSWDMELLPLEIAALQEMNYDLSHLGFDEEKLAKLIEDAKGDTDQPVEPTELESLQPESLALIEGCDRVVLQFSGGKAWYLFADPGIVDTFEIGYLRGRCTPTVEQGETDFDTLGIKFRVFIDLGVREQDWRGVFKAKGEA